MWVKRGFNVPRWMSRGILIAATGLFQLNILYFLWPFAVKPDLLLILVIVMAMNSEFRKIAGYVLFCGLLKDAFALKLFGFNFLLFSIEAFWISYICRRLYYQEKAWFGFIFLASAGLFNYLILTVMLRRPYILIGLAETVLNCLFLPIIEKLYPADWRQAAGGR